MRRVRSPLKSFLMIKTYVKHVSTGIKPATFDCCMHAACLSLSRDLLFLVVVDKVRV